MMIDVNVPVTFCDFTIKYRVDELWTVMSGPTNYYTLTYYNIDYKLLLIFQKLCHLVISFCVSLCFLCKQHTRLLNLPNPRLAGEEL
jgi:hypothetical protein